MEIHKPRPIHSWRELATEIGVIVVGVLIALGLEQAVEAYHDRERLEETTQAIDAEIREGLASAQILADMEGCQQQQLAVLSDAVGKGDRARVRRLLAEADIYEIVPFRNAAWTAALASDVSNHFDRRQQTTYPSLFYVAEKQANWTSDYFRAEQRLVSFAKSGLSQAPAASADAVAEVAEMSSILSNMQGSARAYRALAAQGLGMKPSQPDIDAVLRNGDSVARCNAAAAEMAAQYRKD